MNHLAILGTTQLLLVASLALIPLIALVDILRNEFSGSNKLIWAFVVVLVPGLGAILYFLIGVKQKIRPGN